jgi:hypothetical protein
MQGKLPIMLRKDGTDETVAIKTNCFSSIRISVSSIAMNKAHELDFFGWKEQAHH